MSIIAQKVDAIYALIKQAYEGVKTSGEGYRNLLLKSSEIRRLKSEANEIISNALEDSSTRKEGMGAVLTISECAYRLADLVEENLESEKQAYDDLIAFGWEQNGALLLSGGFFVENKDDDRGDDDFEEDEEQFVEDVIEDLPTKEKAIERLQETGYTEEEATHWVEAYHKKKAKGGQRSEEDGDSNPEAAPAS